MESAGREQRPGNGYLGDGDSLLRLLTGNHQTNSQKTIYGCDRLSRTVEVRSAAVSRRCVAPDRVFVPNHSGVWCPDLVHRSRPLYPDTHRRSEWGIVEAGGRSKRCRARGSRCAVDSRSVCPATAAGFWYRAICCIESCWWLG